MPKTVYFTNKALRHLGDLQAAYLCEFDTKVCISISKKDDHSAYYGVIDSTMAKLYYNVNYRDLHIFISEIDEFLSQINGQYLDIVDGRMIIRRFPTSDEIVNLNAHEEIPML